MTTAGSLREAGTRGVLWGVLERWFSRVGSFIVLVVLGRLLMPEDFGLVATAALFVDFAGMFVGAGLAMYVVQSQRSTRDELSTGFWVSTAIASALAVAIAVAAPLAAAAMDQADLTPILRVLCLVLLIGGLTEVPTGILTRDLRFRAIAIRALAAMSLSSAVATTLAVLGAGVWSLVAQSLTYNLVRLVAVYVACGWWPKLVFERDVARHMLAFGWKMTSINVVHFTRTRGEELLIGALSGPATLGIWVIAKRLALVIMQLFAGVISRVTTPVFAAAKSDPERLGRGYRSGVSMTASIMAPVLAIVAAISPTVIPVLFGSQWQRSGIIAAALCTGAIVGTSSYLDRGLLIALDRSGVELALTAATLLAHLSTVAAVILMGQPLWLLALALALLDALYMPIRLVVIQHVSSIRTAALAWSLLRIWSCAAAGGLFTVAVMRLEIPIPEIVAAAGAGIGGLFCYFGLLRLVHAAAFADIVGLHRLVRQSVARRTA